MAKQQKMTITNLTPTQFSIIFDIISTVKDIMEWDEDVQEFTDHDNFIYSMSKEEHDELMAIEL